MKSLQNNSLSIKTPHFVHHLPISTPFHLSIPKSFPSLFSNLQTKCLKTRVPNLLKIKLFNSKTPTLFDLSASHLPLMVVVSIPSPCLAAGTEEMSPKINIESILVSIDDFFNRYPYFVASLAFVWLVAIPLTQEYLNKYKFISAIDAFRKLRDEPSSQLLDIRKKQSVAYLKTPNLKILNKVAVSLEFVEGCEEEFIKEVLKNFEDPGNTTLCVLDNFDGNSLKVAKLLFENGFKEVYAIKGGILGKDGWQAIQEKLLPPSVHVYPKKKSRTSSDQDDERGEGNEEHEENRQILTSSSRNQEAIQNIENGYTKSRKSSSTSHVHGKPLSPYPNFKGLKPPSSPTPSKP